MDVINASNDRKRNDSIKNEGEPSSGNELALFYCVAP